jgi:hypothetical protein
VPTGARASAGRSPGLQPPDAQLQLCTEGLPHGARAGRALAPIILGRSSSYLSPPAWIQRLSRRARLMRSHAVVCWGRRVGVSGPAGMQASLCTVRSSAAQPTADRATSAWPCFINLDRAAVRRRSPSEPSRLRRRSFVPPSFAQASRRDARGRFATRLRLVRVRCAGRL